MAARRRPSLLAAVVLAGIGYAEGGALSQRLGGPAVISWALIVALPFTLPVTVWDAAEHGLHATPRAWTAFAYVSCVSMLLAFFAWYTALARAGVARIGQLQLAQPSLTLLWSGALLGEWPAAWTIAAAAVILAAVAALPHRPRGNAREARAVSAETSAIRVLARAPVAPLGRPVTTPAEEPS